MWIWGLQEFRQRYVVEGTHALSLAAYCSKFVHLVDPLHLRDFDSVLLDLHLEMLHCQVTARRNQQSTSLTSLQPSTSLPEAHVGTFARAPCKPQSLKV